MKFLFFVVLILLQSKKYVLSSETKKFNDLILNNFNEISKSMVSEKCRDDLNYTIISIKDDQTWAKSSA